MKGFIATATFFAIAGISMCTPVPADAKKDNHRHWMVRVRAVDSMPTNRFPALFYGAAPSIEHKVYPEADISYFVEPHLAAELSMTYPQRQNLLVNGFVSSSFYQTPSTLTMQYHFSPSGTIQPYVGAGVNYTRFGNFGWLPGGQLSSYSWGPAFQAGSDFRVGNSSYVNLDAKYVMAGANIGGSNFVFGSANLSSVIVGLGYGLRF
jgi:outer membrane protein